MFLLVGLVNISTFKFVDYIPTYMCNVMQIFHQLARKNSVLVGDHAHHLR